jgi:hypothetical protein
MTQTLNSTPLKSDASPCCCWRLTWSSVLMVGDRPPCTQKIWLSMMADKLQQQQQQQHTKQSLCQQTNIQSGLLAVGTRQDSLVMLSKGQDLRDRAAAGSCRLAPSCSCPQTA